MIALLYPVETLLIDEIPRPRKLALKGGRKLGRQAPDGQQSHHHPRGLVLGEYGHDHLDEHDDGQFGQEQAGDVQQIRCVGRLQMLDVIHISGYSRSLPSAPHPPGQRASGRSAGRNDCPSRRTRRRTAPRKRARQA